MRGTVEIFTDGACSGNPGPGGWGVILRYRGMEKEMFGGEPETTNNRMELRAVIEGLRALNRPSSVDVFTDSRYVQQGVTEWIRRWRMNGWKTAGKQPVKNQDLWQALDAAQEGHAVRWHWVKGHNNHAENERADELARRGITELRA